MNHFQIANCVHGLDKIKEESKISSTSNKLSLSLINQKLVRREWIIDALSFVPRNSFKIIAVERVQSTNCKKLFRPYRIQHFQTLSDIFIFTFCKILMKYQNNEKASTDGLS
jgi:hypothetical protein